MVIKKYRNVILVLFLIQNLVYGIQLESVAYGNSKPHQLFDEKDLRGALKSLKDIDNLTEVIGKINSDSKAGLLKNECEKIKQRKISKEEDSLYRHYLKLTNIQNRHSGIEFKLRNGYKYIDDLGRKHVTFDQYCYGYRVIGAFLTLHLNSDNTVYYISSLIDPEISISSITPLVKKKEALRIVGNVLNVECSEDQKLHEIFPEEPEMVIVCKRLAYHVKPEKGISEFDFYIDCMDGSNLYSTSRLAYLTPPTNGSASAITGNQLYREGGGLVSIDAWRQTGSNLYYMFSADHLWGVYDANTSAWFTNSSSSWGDANRGVISAGKNIELVQAFCQEFLSDPSVKWSHDGQGSVIEVRYGPNSQNTPYYYNHTLYITDSVDIAHSPASVLDCIAHEYGHALTRFSSNLSYSGDECAALNEAYSDIFMSLVEQWLQPPQTNSYPYWQDGCKDWYYGEDYIWTNDQPNRIPWHGRDLRNPYNSSTPGPLYYRGTNWLPTTDDDYRHVNGTLVGHIFYMLVEGYPAGSYDGDWHPANGGLGLEQAGHVAMDANLIYHSGGTSSDFAYARKDWLTAAVHRGYDVGLVAQAWEACGVGDYSLTVNMIIEDTRTITSDYVQIGKPGTATYFFSTSDVTAQAEVCIVIKPEVEIRAGAEFHASIVP